MCLQLKSLMPQEYQREDPTCQNTGQSSIIPFLLGFFFGANNELRSREELQTITLPRTGRVKPMSEMGQVQDYLLRVVQIPARHTRTQNTSVDRSLELCSNLQLKNIHVPSSSKTQASLLAGLTDKQYALFFGRGLLSMYPHVCSSSRRKKQAWWVRGMPFPSWIHQILSPRNLKPGR